MTGETFWVLLGGDSRDRSAFGIGVLRHDEKKAYFAGRAPRGHARDAARSRALEGGTLVRLGPKSALIETETGTSLILLRGNAIAILANGEPTDEELSLDDARKSGDSIARAVAASAVSLFRAELAAALKKGANRVERRVVAVEKDLAAMAKADDMLLSAQWLLPLAGARRREAKEKSWPRIGPRIRRVKSKCRSTRPRSPKDQIDGMFKRARRLKAGRAYAEPRLASAVLQRDSLRALLARAMEASTLDALAEIAEEARKAAPKDFALQTEPDGSSARTPHASKKDSREREHGHRIYSGTDGARIFVGRTSMENDELTFKVARPHDLWLHAKGRRGAHVVVPRDRGEGITPELLVDAAHLAAHFSEARERSGRRCRIHSSQILEEAQRWCAGACRCRTRKGDRRANRENETRSALGRDIVRRHPVAQGRSRDAISRFISSRFAIARATIGVRLRAYRLRRA